MISFDKFLELLENDIIVVDLIARINKSGRDKGRYRNKNLVFSIKKHDIKKLFDVVYIYDSDCIENDVNPNFFIMN